MLKHTLIPISVWPHSDEALWSETLVSFTQRESPELSPVMTFETELASCRLEDFGIIDATGRSADDSEILDAKPTRRRQ